jgi:tetratricopeptide (TPR) repeat protein
MTATPLWRRLAIALLSLALSSLFFRGAVSVALVTRGDGFFQKGQLERARVYYARALFFDRSSALAADRFAFAGFEMRTPEAIASSLRVTSQALALAPSDVKLLEDRGLLYQLQRRYGLARVDLERAAILSGDSRWYHLAAWASYRSGDPERARRLWYAALHRNPSFVPARLALAKIGGSAR